MRLFVLSVAATVSVGLAGCTPSPDAESPSTISWSGVSPAIEQMVRDYVTGRGVPPELQSEILNPKYYARPTPYFLFEGNDDAVTLALSARLGTSYPPVDVYFIDLYWFKDFEPQWLTSMQPLTIPVNRRQVALREVLPAGLREACELGSNLYAVPFSIRGNCLYYRTDLIDKPPATWPELLETAKRVLGQRAPGSKLKYGLVFHWYELQNDLYPVLWGYGGGPPSCLLPNGRLDQLLDCAANLEALAMFYGLIHADRITPELSTLRATSLTEEKRLFESFAAGETLFLIDWTNRAARIAAVLARLAPAGLTLSHFGIAPLPHAAGHRQSYSTIGSWGWVVASNPRTDHSLEFVRELATPGAQLYFFENHAEVPIFSEQILTRLDQWPTVAVRMTPYHNDLLRLVHGTPQRPGVVFRNRPGRKEINRLVLTALQEVLSLPAKADSDDPFDREKASRILRDTDQKILKFLERLESLGLDCSCPQPAASTATTGQATPMQTGRSW